MRASYAGALLGLLKWRDQGTNYKHISWAPDGHKPFLIEARLREEAARKGLRVYCLQYKCARFLDARAVHLADCRNK